MELLIFLGVMLVASYLFHGWAVERSDFWFIKFVTWIYEKISSQVKENNEERYNSRQLAIRQRNIEERAYNIAKKYLIQSIYENKILKLDVQLVFNINEDMYNTIISNYGNVERLKSFIIDEIQSILHLVLQHLPLNSILVKLTKDRHSIKQIIAQKILDSYGYYIHVNDFTYSYQESQFLPEGNLKKLPPLSEKLHMWELA